MFPYKAEEINFKKPENHKSNWTLDFYLLPILDFLKPHQQHKFLLFPSSSIHQKSNLVLQNSTNLKGVKNCSGIPPKTLKTSIYSSHNWFKPRISHFPVN